MRTVLQWRWKLGLDTLVPKCPAVSPSQRRWRRRLRSRAKACLFNRRGGNEIKRHPPTGVKYLPWESFGSDSAMTYLTTENKQQLCYRKGHDRAGYGSPACCPLLFKVYSHWGQGSHARLPSGLFLDSRHRTKHPCLKLKSEIDSLWFTMCYCFSLSYSLFVL